MTIDEETYKNIGVSYSQQLVDGSYVNYYQGQFISTSGEAMDAQQTVLNDRGLAGFLLSTDSPLSGLSQQGLMTDMIHQAQGDFIIGAIEFGGTALEITGNGIAVTGYAVSATGVGAGVGAAMSGLGNGMSYAGTGMKMAISLKNKDYGQAGISFVSGAMNFGIGGMAKYGATGRETIEAGTNLFFAPANAMIGNIQYKN